MLELFSVPSFIDKMHRSSNVRHHLYISYGALNHIFSFLEPNDILSFQALSNFMYHRGVERQQRSIQLRTRMLYFHFSGVKQWRYSLFVYDSKLGVAQRTVCLREWLGVDLLYAKIVQIKESVLVFQPESGVIKVTRLDYLSTTNPVSI